ncbi:hypothetical protein NV379_02380 [Paenibacillus sp. N1-5-1-14]|uniref:hypothetical protein n=1 Tax=Paenibacillus radicibacter TaxID=2972488 RepID=UPI0021590DEA|nr:hypothetical protein [Paenibacillus radicibacter]MCR8641494.1 hypothetical protein [Paenibacillus radicibacter]
MYRVINHDINDDILDKVDTIEQAKKVQEENYFFMTGIQELKSGKWIDVDGVHEELSDYISNALR